MGWVELKDTRIIWKATKKCLKITEKNGRLWSCSAYLLISKSVIVASGYSAQNYCGIYNKGVRWRKGTAKLCNVGPLNRFYYIEQHLIKT